MNSIQDALLKTAAGRTLVIEAKTRQASVGERIRQLKELTYDTFVANPGRAGFDRNFGRTIYQRSKETIRKIGQLGGAEYDEALAAVKFAWTSKEAFQEAFDILAP